MRVEALRLELTVEKLDEGIVGRLAGAGEVGRDALLAGPNSRSREINSEPW